MLHNKMLAVIEDVNAEVAEREDSIECTAIALVTRKNMLKLGDTGQAKTLEIIEFCKRIIGAKKFEQLLTKQTEEDALFGRIDLSTMIPGNADEKVLANDSYYQTLLSQLQDLTSNNPQDIDNLTVLLNRLEIRKKALYALYGNKPKLITAGKIPEADIVFLDEIWKSNEGLLNSLLTATNEHKFTNEGETIDLRVISFFAASNEKPNFKNPEDIILRPLFDRFELKVLTQYIQNRDNLLRVMLHKQSGAGEQISATITLDELYAMQKEVSAVVIPVQITNLMIDVALEFRERGIHVSDRKIANYSPVARAKAWLSGRNTVDATDLSTMKYCFWTNFEEIPVIQKVLDKFCLNPLQEEIRKITALALESYADFNANLKANANSNKAVIKLRGELARTYRMLMKIRNETTDTDAKTAVAKAIDELEDISKEAHKTTALTYAPLSLL